MSEHAAALQAGLSMLTATHSASQLPTHHNGSAQDAAPVLHGAGEELHAQLHFVAAEDLDGLVGARQAQASVLPALLPGAPQRANEHLRHPVRHVRHLRLVVCSKEGTLLGGGP